MLMLRMFTFRPREEIAALIDGHQKDPGSRVPHHQLAFDITRDVHGEGAARAVQQALRGVFSETRASVADSIERLAKAAPEKVYHWHRTQPPKVEDLFVAAGLASSKGDAQRLIAGGGLYLNDRVRDYGTVVGENEVQKVSLGRYVLLRKGKKTYQPLKITGLD